MCRSVDERWIIDVMSEMMEIVVGGSLKVIEDEDCC